MSVDPGAVRLQGFQGPCLAPAPEGLQAPILLCPCLVLITLFTMIELLFILYISARGTTAMCGIIASLDVEWMIYLNCQTKPSDHQLSEAKGPVGRVGTVSVERNRQRPPPPPKFTQAHEKEASKPTRTRCKERVMTRRLSISPVWSMTTNFLTELRLNCSTTAFQLHGTPSMLS